MDASDTIHILGIAGSLRRESFNRTALRAAQGLVPAGARLEIFDLADLPLFNADREHELPEPVARLKARVRASDAVLFVSPEHNYSVPGVLMNAIDWASRPSGDSAWKGRAAAIMGASTGAYGTVRAQFHLRQVLVGVDMPTVLRPEVMIGHAAKAFDAAGGFADPALAERVRELLAALVELARLHRAPAARPAS